MSYILEALKKSDRQRQHGATPTLSAAQATVAAPKKPLFMYYGLLAAALLGAGITIGWLRPWHAEQPATEPIAAKPTIQVPHQASPAPLLYPPEIAKKIDQTLPAQNSTPAVQPAPEVDAIKPDALAPEKPASQVVAAQEQGAISMAELPLAIQQEIPAMMVQLHAYSSDPAERLVSVNSRLLHEGGSLAPGLRLEQVTPDGMIFSYKGYRFQHGIR